jgi:hypothetical protein
MWHLFQLLIMFIVGGTNIVYEWTDNGYVVGLVGMAVSYCATVVLYVLLSTLRSFVRRCLGTDPYPHGDASRHVDRLPRSTWRAREAPEDSFGSWIGDDPGKLGEVISGLPLAPHLVSRVPPFPGRRRGLGKVRD